MRQLKGRPPIFDEIVRVFPQAAGPRVVFSWGDVIYVPSGMPLPASILAHEEAHGERQRGHVEDWWRRYLDDPAFRFDEELIGHRAELRELFKAVRDRNQRARYVSMVARKLASPLYGSLISPWDASRQLRGGI